MTLVTLKPLCLARDKLDLAVEATRLLLGPALEFLRILGIEPRMELCSPISDN